VQEVDDGIALPVAAVPDGEVDGHLQPPFQRPGREGRVDHGRLDGDGVRMGGRGDEDPCREPRDRSAQAHRTTLAV
jgi:hypothetical protein